MKTHPIRAALSGPLLNHAPAVELTLEQHQRITDRLKDSLDLPDDAPAERFLEAIDAADTETIELQKENDLLTNAAAELREALLNREKEVYADLIADNADHWSKQLLTNRAETVKHFDQLRAGGRKAPAAIVNREKGKNPGSEDVTGEVDSKEVVRASVIRNRAAQIDKEFQCGWGEAWRRAESEQAK